MTQQTINVGAAPADGTGDPARTAFTKCNANFTELYATGTAGGGPPQGRLTLLTATPVMTTTQSAKTTLYYSPYCGNQIGLYDGSAMVPTTFTELSVATTDTTKSPAAIGASKVNDWFVWSDAGTIRLGHGPDWTSATVRSAGTALVMVSGLLLNSISITNGPAAQRGTYVGTTRSNASSQLDWIYGGPAALGTAAFFGVWNTYNRVQVSTSVRDSTDTWTYGTVAWRSANAAATMRVSYVAGLNDESVIAIYHSFALANGTSYPYVGVGLDTTTAYSGTTGGNLAGVAINMVARYEGNPDIGFHFLQAIEYATTTTAVTFVGDGTAPTWISTGLFATLKM